MLSLPILGQPPQFSSLEEEAYLGMLQAADRLSRPVEALFKPTGLSPTQFNVLRILSAAGDAGLPCGHICEQMITRDPDMTRLLDRLEKRDLITRSRDVHDRRVVRATITPAAMKLLATLDEPLRALQRRQLRHLNQDRLRLLIDLLELARSGDSLTETKLPAGSDDPAKTPEMKRLPFLKEGTP
jgi:DNA-binding MarR family transcriptional regulator